MMKTRFFFVIYPNNDSIKTILDGMRIIADPQQRNFSHITVKGPYQSKQKKLLSKDSELIQGKKIKVMGAGNFFVNNQNTVFFRCEEKKELLEIWKAKEEKTYKEFHPHITIYDGDNRQFANDLYNTINAHKINFSFIVEKLDLYSSADKTRLFNLKAQVNYPVLSSWIGINVNQNNIDTLTDKQKISAIDILCKMLTEVNGLTGYSEDETHNLKNQELLIEA